MNAPLPSETEIFSRSAADRASVDDRIDWLKNDYFIKVAATPDGWDRLYRDPQDGRLWELFYPFSESHGGGPPKLQVVGYAAAAKKYKLP